MINFNNLNKFNIIVNITNMEIKNIFNKLFKYNSNDIYNFSISNNQNNNAQLPEEQNSSISTNISENLEFLKIKYNTLLRNDIILIEFNMPALCKN